MSQTQEVQTVMWVNLGRDMAVHYKATSHISVFVCRFADKNPEKVYRI